METVTIGCKTPNGMILEVGYEIDKQGGVSRKEDYKAVVVRGWNSNNPPKIQMPASHEPSPGITENVLRAFWERWKKENANNRLLKEGLLYEAKNRLEADARALDVAQKPLGLEALDPAKVPPQIKKAVFDDDKAA